MMNNDVVSFGHWVVSVLIKLFGGAVSWDKDFIERLSMKKL